MAVTRMAQPGSAVDGRQPRSVWRKVVRTLDRLVAERSRLAVSASGLRRSRDDIKRCRELMVEGAVLPAGVTAVRAGTVRTLQSSRSR